MSGASDTSLYSFSVTGLGENTFAVLRFEGRETISGPSWTRLLVVSPERGLEHDDIVGKEAVLKVHLNGEHQLHGVVRVVHVGIEDRQRALGAGRQQRRGEPGERGAAREREHVHGRDLRIARRGARRGVPGARRTSTRLRGLDSP